MRAAKIRGAAMLTRVLRVYATDWNTNGDPAVWRSPMLLAAIIAYADGDDSVPMQITQTDAFVEAENRALAALIVHISRCVNDDAEFDSDAAARDMIIAASCGGAQA